MTMTAMRNQKGFVQILVTLAVVAAVAVAGAAIYVAVREQPPDVRVRKTQDVTVQKTTKKPEGNDTGTTVEKPVIGERAEIAAVNKKPAVNKGANQKEIIAKEEKKPEPPPKPPEQKSKTIQTPGYTELIAVADGVAASLSRDDVIQVVDIQDPRSPVKMQTIDTPAFAEAVYQKDGYLYIADSRELRILDSAGKPAGIYNLQNFWPSAIAIQNNYAYLTAGDEMLILEISNPPGIKRVSKISLTGRAPTRVIIHDGYAYVVESLGGLNIVDVRNPAAPKVLKVHPFESHTVGFGIKDNYAYLGRVVSITSNEQGYRETSVFEVIDISHPASATVVSSLELPTNIKGLDLDGNYAYIIGSYPYRLTPIDISAPLNPTIIKARESIVGDADLQDIVVESNYAFLADGSLGLRIVDVSDIVNPKHIKDLDLQGRAFNIYKSGGKLYLAVEQKYFNLADVKNPEAPQPTHSELFTASYGYTNIVLDNRKAYFNGGGARIYNVVNPKSPERIKTSPAEIDSIEIQGNYLYSTIGEIGLLVYDLSNPASLKQISKTPFPTGIPRGLSVDGRWAVGVSNSPYSINLFDIADPKKPVAKQSYLYQKYPNTVTVKDGYAYVARAEDGVDIFRIGPDGTLQLMKNIATKGYAHHVTVVGNKAFVVRDGADVYNVADPGTPIFLFHISNKGEANRVAVDNGYLYIADGYAGVTIVKLPE